MLDDGGADPVIPPHSIFVFHANYGAEKLPDPLQTPIKDLKHLRLLARDVNKELTKSQKDAGWSDRWLQKIIQQVPFL